MNVNSLPDDTLYIIFSHLDDSSAMNFGLTCKRIYTYLFQHEFKELYTTNIVKYSKFRFKYYKLWYEKDLNYRCRFSDIKNLVTGSYNKLNLNKFCTLNSLHFRVINDMDLNQILHFKFNLEELTLDFDCNTLYRNSDLKLPLPKGHIKKLSLIGYFNNPIDNLPNGILNLYLGMDFNQSINKLPKTLKTLTVNGNFEKSLNHLPKNLKNLNINGIYSRGLNSLPKGLYSLNLKSTYYTILDSLPEQLSILKLNREFNWEVNVLPVNLTYLEFGELFNSPVNALPRTLTTLKFGLEFNHPVDNLPDDLKCLHFGDNFNQPVDHLPDGLEILYFGLRFNQPVDNLPKTLKYLYLKDGFNQPIFKLPVDLESLSVNSEFKDPILNLPENLRQLYFGYDNEVQLLDTYGFRGSIKNLPQKLKILKCIGDLKTLNYILKQVEAEFRFKYVILDNGLRFNIEDSKSKFRLKYGLNTKSLTFTV